MTIDALTGMYGQYGWTANPGDRMQARVWNPQTGDRATFDFTMPEWSNCPR